MQELPSRQATPNQRWPNVGSPSTTLDQRHTKIDLTCRVRRAPHMKISRADPPAKLRPRPKAAYTAGPPFRTPAQQQNNIGPMPASSRAMQASASKNPEPKSAQKLDHRLRR